MRKQVLLVRFRVGSGPMWEHLDRLIERQKKAGNALSKLQMQTAMEAYPARRRLRRIKNPKVRKAAIRVVECLYYFLYTGRQRVYFQCVVDTFSHLKRIAISEKNFTLMESCDRKIKEYNQRLRVAHKRERRFQAEYEAALARLKEVEKEEGMA